MTTIARPIQAAGGHIALPRWLTIRRLGLAAEAVVAIQWLLLMVDSDLDQVGRLVGSGLVLASAALIDAMTRNRGAASVGAGAALAGISGITGGGVDVVHTALEGFSPANVVGLVALVSGVALLAAGTVLLVGVLPRWWKLLAIPVGLVVAQFGLLPLTAAVYGTHVPYVPVTAAAPADTETVSLMTNDGVRLSAWYTPSRTGATVVLLHGAGGSRADTAGHAAVLVRHGYGVLALDARGGSAATATGVVWGWHGDQDVAAAVDFLRARSDVDPGRIAAVGLSMGAEEAITAAAGDPRLKAVVAEGASVRTAADLVWLGDDLLGWIERLETHVMFGAADLMTAASQPMPLTEAVRAMAPTPLLLISSADPDEALANGAFKAIAPDRVTLWELADTPHIGGLAVHPLEWEQRVVDFLDASV